jgi:hypothetical protein
VVRAFYNNKGRRSDLEASPAWLDERNPRHQKESLRATFGSASLPMWGRTRAPMSLRAAM